jgi:hypothetical protein
MISIATEAGEPLRGRLSYVTGEHSFRFDASDPEALSERAGDEGVTSLAVGTLQLEVGVASRRALYVWGLHPRARWTDAAIGTPAFRAAVVLVAPGHELIAGVSLSVAPVGTWITRHDQRTGWVAVTPDLRDDVELVEIADGVLVGRRDGHLAAVWLRPVLA